METQILAAGLDPHVDKVVVLEIVLYELYTNAGLF